MKTLTVFMANAAAALCLLSALWTLASTMELWPRLEVALHADQYQRETLLVETIDRESFKRKGGSSSITCHAEGPAGATRERLALSDCAEGPDGRVLTQEAAKGDRIEVLVNRAISTTGPVAARRTLRYRADFREQAWQRVTAFLPLAYGPLLVPAVIALLLGLVARRAYAARAGFWCIWPVAFVLVAQGIGLAIALR